MPAVLPNAWLGVSVESQRLARVRLPLLADTPAVVRFASCEPLLGALDIRPWLAGGLDWVIAGVESGPKPRPMHPDWARSLRDQCQAAGVAFFSKLLCTDCVAVEDSFPEALIACRPGQRVSVGVRSQESPADAREVDAADTGSEEIVLDVGGQVIVRGYDMGFDVGQRQQQERDQTGSVAAGTAVNRTPPGADWASALMTAAQRSAFRSRKMR